MADIVRMKPLDSDWSHKLAAIHMAEIHLGVLPLLGERFLARLYRGLAGAPRSGVWSAIEDGRIVGFLAGCADAERTYRRVLLGGCLPLGAGLAARLIVSRALRRKVWSLIGYMRHGSTATAGKDQGGPHAELLAIAVAGGYQGRGTGRRLVEAFEAAVRDWGVERYWVSTNVAENASNRFYRSLGFVPAGTIPHHDLTLQQYCKSLQPTTS